MKRYRICSKYMVGSNIVGYEVEGDGDGRKLLKIEDIYKLVESGELEGCSIIEYKGEKHLKIEGGIKNLKLSMKGLPTTLLKIKERLIKDGQLAGYILEDETKQLYRLSKDKVWYLALLGLVDGVKAYAYKNKKILKGINIHSISSKAL